MVLWNAIVCYEKSFNPPKATNIKWPRLPPSVMRMFAEVFSRNLFPRSCSRMRASYPVPFWRIARQSTSRCAASPRGLSSTPKQILLHDDRWLAAVESNGTSLQARRQLSHAVSGRATCEWYKHYLFFSYASKAFEYGVVNVLRTYRYKYATCGYFECIHGKSWISNYVLWQSSSDRQFPEVAYVCLIWKLGLLRISGSDPYSSGWWIRIDGIVNVVKAGRGRADRCRPRDLLLSLLGARSLFTMWFPYFGVDLRREK